MLLDTLGQAYHWSFADMRSLTMKQVLMLNHAAYINGERREASAAHREKTGEGRLADHVADALDERVHPAKMSRADYLAQFKNING